MKIARFFHDGETRYGIVEGDAVYPCEGDPFSGLARTSTAPDRRLRSNPRGPVSPPNIICLGLNYRSHADEAGAAYPKATLIFMKPTTSVCGPGDPIILPEGFESSIDYEAELAIVIGKQARGTSHPADVPGASSSAAPAGNDVSNRAAQFKDGQWDPGERDTIHFVRSGRSSRRTSTPTT